MCVNYVFDLTGRCSQMTILSDQCRTEGGVWGVQTPPPKFRRPFKIVPKLNPIC